MNVSELIRVRRQELGLSLADLAARINLLGVSVSRQAVWQWEKGKRSPPIDDIEFVRALSNALDMSVVDFLSQSGYIQTSDSGPARRAYELMLSLPEEKQELALKLIQQLVEV